MPMLPVSGDSFLVRTDFTRDAAWERVRDEALAENEDGFRAYAEPVDDRAFDDAGWEAVRAAIPGGDRGAAVLFIADSLALTASDHPILVVDLLEEPARSPFRCVPGELWSVDNNLNIANMDWEDFVGAVGDDGVFRGFG